MIDKNMRERLESIKKRDSEIMDQMMDQAVLSDRKMMSRLGKEKASYEATLTTYAKYLEAESIYNQALEMLENTTEAELLELAEMERDEYQEILDNLTEELYRMYTRYAETLGYSVNVLEARASEAGGYSMISFEVKGSEPYRHFKFESGAHRVQRVPKTETQGRVHTSTATVLVLADVEDDEVEIDPNDLVIETHRATGAGGQHVNKTDSAVRITHTPTGISVNCQDGRSQHDNKDKAMRLIRARVFEAHKKAQEAKASEVRQSKIGSGDRSEKIRTYNYPQNRVSDHRIGLTLQKLDFVMEGKIGRAHV